MVGIRKRKITANYSIVTAEKNGNYDCKRAQGIYHTQ